MDATSVPPCHTVQAGSIPDPAVQDSVVSNVSTLTDGWTLSHLGGDPAPFPIEELPAQVPGCVHTDLLAADLIADPYHGTNEHLTDWIGRSDFRYRCRFSTEPPDGEECTTLRFEGIDTIAKITLNGTLLGTVRDMHRSYEFDVTDLLITRADRQNVLDVVISAPVTEARAAAERMGDRPQSGNAYPFNAIRKMACNFGWDWGPDLVTSGIFRPVRLIRWRTARLMDPVSVVASLETIDDHSQDRHAGVIRVRPLVELDPGLAEVDEFIEADLEAQITVTGPVHIDPDDTGATSTPLASTRVPLTGDDDITLDIPEPELWWPVGEGDQPLYQVEIALIGPDGDMLDRRQRKLGFRTVELLTRPDDFGTSFTVRINGRELFLRGANWIPDDVFVSRVTPEDYQRGIDDALDAHMNVLRIWGGGLFADEWMLDRCDQLGLLVWQDFLFACAAYSEDAELSEQVAAEATENVVRMASHPALILWNGCNENVEGYVHWGWQDTLAPGQSWGLGYYTELLPQIVARWDGTRPYTPTSPFNPRDLMDPRNPDHGSVHSWSVWNQIDYTHYRDSVPRFCAEFGFQGPAERATLGEYLDDDPLTPGSPGMLLHEKAADGLRKLNDGFAPHLPQPADFEDWHLTTSLNQARAMECGISWFRSWWPRCAGSIIWQLNDCWPVSSWAAVDSRGRRKLLWYALRDLYDDHFSPSSRASTAPTHPGTR
ncbi:MAG: glycoside hydrolase family 2 protein [Acidipropionibacterium sp.]|jgi:beta-mannosidase|nr:glycoside hydrolase family 2 protein [Acidipropionibacterium sp.]